MGLFDTLFSSKSVTSHSANYTPHSEYEAWVAILYACMSADGEISDVEIDAMARLLLFKNKFATIDILPLFQNAMNGKMRVGFFSLVENSTPLIKEEDKPTLLALATELILADGVITEKEKEIIEFLAKQLHLDESLAARIIEVTLIKNRDNRIFA